MAFKNMQAIAEDAQRMLFDLHRLTAVHGETFTGVTFSVHFVHPETEQVTFWTFDVRPTTHELQNVQEVEEIEEEDEDDEDTTPLADEDLRAAFEEEAFGQRQEGV